MTPVNGFTGKVTLACSIGEGPARAADAPSCSVTQPTAISQAQPVSATLTVSTAGTSSAALRIPLRQVLALGGSGILAAFFFCLPIRRRRWQKYFGLVVLLSLCAGASACGVTQLRTSETTAGSYTVTVTGADGPLQVSTALTFLVN